MLFPYVYVPHKMEKMQEFIDFIFFEVWCKAPGTGPFDLSLFTAKPELHEVMTSFYYSDTKGADFFFGHVERIYGLFAALTASQIQQFEQWYRGNNDIENVCANDPAAQLVRYAEIPAAHKDLGEQIKSFFKGLYSNVLCDPPAAIKQKIGDIDDHYRTFVQVNNVNRCPFCGINGMLDEYSSKREAYDHYLPKALYPFNSVNFRNLVPACHHCNSSYKTSKDPARPAKDPAGVAQRRKAFYPFRTNARAIEIVVNIAHPNVDAMRPEDIDLQFGPAELDEEIATWCDVYGIEERYRSKMLGENDGKFWIMQVLDEWSEDGKLPAEFLTTLARQTNKSPFAESNFLKMAFLEGCERRGLFAAMKKVT